MKKILILAVVMVQFMSFGYEIPLSDEETTSLSCKLSMQLNMAAPDKEAATGRAVVAVTLIDGEGKPLPGYQVQLTSTGGTFVCNLPEERNGATGSDDVDRSCFFTGADGKIMVHLINLPLNKSVQVKAICDCGGYQVFSTGNINYNRKVIQKKK